MPDYGKFSYLDLSEDRTLASPKPLYEIHSQCPVLSSHVPSKQRTFLILKQYALQALRSSNNLKLKRQDSPLYSYSTSTFTDKSFNLDNETTHLR